MDITIQNAKTWGCKIGEVDPKLVPSNGDLPMRKAVEKAYKEITGQEPSFIFSGWGEELTLDESNALKEFDPTPCCYQHGVGAISTSESCPKIADND